MALALCVINTGLFAESPDTTRYDKRIHHYRQNWESLIPTQLILQTCGNMGLFSVGVGLWQAWTMGDSVAVWLYSQVQFPFRKNDDHAQGELYPLVYQSQERLVL